MIKQPISAMFGSYNSVPPNPANRAPKQEPPKAKAAGFKPPGAVLAPKTVRPVAPSAMSSAKSGKAASTPAMKSSPGGAAQEKQEDPVSHAGAQSTPGPASSPRARGKDAPQPPQTGPSRRVGIDEFSMQPPSWWREEQPKMRAHFTVIFVKEYGQSILGGIKVRAQNAVDWSWQIDNHGCVMGDDGRSSVLALLDIKEKIEGGTLDRADCCAAVLQAIDDGVMATPVFYGTTDTLHPVAWNIAAHAEENVQFLSSTVVDHIDLVLKLAKSFPVESKWEDAQRYLNGLLVNKRREVGRWVKMAKTMPASVVDFLRARVKSRGVGHGVKSSFFDNNQYVCAPVAADTMLPEDLLLTVVQAMFDTMDQGITVTLETFTKSYCEPARVVKEWRAKVTRKYRAYGASSEPQGPWSVLCHSLIRDDALRAQVAACLQASTTLESIPAVKNQLNMFRKARDEEKARKKAEAEAGQAAIRAECENIRQQANDEALAREVR